MVLGRGFAGLLGRGPHRAGSAARRVARRPAVAGSMPGSSRPPIGSRSARTVRRCWPASTSVGAMMVAWWPDCDRDQGRVERDHRLARTDVALEEAVHRARARHVLRDLLRSPVAGRRSARTAAPARNASASSAVDPMRHSLRPPLHASLPERHPQLEREQLVELQPLRRRAPAPRPSPGSGSRGSRRSSRSAPRPATISAGSGSAIGPSRSSAGTPARGWSGW